MQRDPSVIFSPFGTMLCEICRRMEVSPYELALRLGISRSRLGYALRSRWAPGKSCLLTYRELFALAHQVQATDEERDALIWLGLKEYMPPEARARVEQLEREADQARIAAGRPPARRAFRPPA